jgi:hypothetical protein
MINLASAYLTVRSRRLNILFMWGLKRLESDMVANAKPHNDAEDSGCQANHFELRKRRMLSWSFLSREIADLNHRYLC